MIAYQTVSGAGNATGFAESMHTLVEHLEARKQQLAAELDETNAAIEVLKRLGKGDSGTKDTALASSESSLDQNGKTTSRRGRRAANPSKKTADLTTEEDEKRSGFSPRTSVLRSFHGKTLRESIKLVLGSQMGEPFSVNDVIYSLYGKNLSKESLKAARPVVLAELSKGKMSNHWSNVEGRKGYYMLTDTESDSNE